MEARSQFTFYRSYYDAIQRLSKKDQAAIILAICAYALYEQEPQSLSRAAATAFELIRPTLNTARRKAANGKQGGSKPKANRKQTESKKENEVEIENEIEHENDKRSKPEARLPNLSCNPPSVHAPAPFDSQSFSAFWDTYPARNGIKSGREAAWEAWRKLSPTPDQASQILFNLRAWKISGQWTDDGDRFIPKAAKFLSDPAYYATAPAPSKHHAIPKGASGELGEAELEAIRRVLQEE